MDKPKDELTKVTREEYRQNPRAVWDKVEKLGAVGIVDHDGRQRTVLHHVQSDRADV